MLIFALKLKRWAYKLSLPNLSHFQLFMVISFVSATSKIEENDEK